MDDGVPDPGLRPRRPHRQLGLPARDDDDRRGDRPVGREPGARSSPSWRWPALFVLVVHDLLPADALGPAKFVVEGSVAITVATMLVALTGGVVSPFFFVYPLIVGGAALVVTPSITLGLAATAALGYLLAVLLGTTVSSLACRSRRPRSGINLTAMILLAYVAMVIAREQRRSRDAAIRLSTIDPLTQLFNRGFFFAALEREIARSARSGRGFCLLMMDLDELKVINDRLGHFHGDRVLRAVGEVVTRRRPTDRYGGPLRRRRVRRPPARDGSRPARSCWPRRSGSASRTWTSSCPRRRQAVAVRRRRQLPRRRHDRRRADDQRRRGDVHLQAQRQEPRHRRQHADRPPRGDLGPVGLPDVGPRGPPGGVGGPARGACRRAMARSHRFGTQASQPINVGRVCRRNVG